MTRSKLLASLHARLDDPTRSVDELRVIAWVLAGLELGAKSYGPLTIDTDPRDFIRERAMECRDLLFYSAAQAIARHDAEQDGEP